MTTMTKTAIENLSWYMNNENIHKGMAEIIETHFGKKISGDDPVWTELEELIIKKLKQA